MSHEQPRPEALMSPSDVIQAGALVRVDGRHRGGRLHLVVSGEADIDTAEAMGVDLARSLTSATRSVAVDVSQLTFCDLAGLEALNGFLDDMAARQLPAAMEGMSPLLTWMREVFMPLCVARSEQLRTDA